MLKESIADLVIQEHYEQRFLDLEYIFQQDHFGSNTYIRRKQLRVVVESINTKMSHRNESCSKEMGDFIRESD
jgi:hypothetical protein